MSSSAEIGKHYFRYMSHCSGFDSSIVLYFGVKTNNCVVLYFWNNNTMWGSPERIMRFWDLKWKSNKLPFACSSIKSKKSDSFWDRFDFQCRLFILRFGAVDLWISNWKSNKLSSAARCSVQLSRRKFSNKLSVNIELNFSCFHCFSASTDFLLPLLHGWFTNSLGSGNFKEKGKLVIISPFSGKQHISVKQIWFWFH